MAIRIPLLLLVSCAAACAGPTRSHPRDHAGRVRFSGGQFDAVFRTAVRTISTAGQPIETCDADRPKLATSRIEIDAPCGNTTCLARQSTAVLLGYRAAKVTIMREVWNPSVRAWVPAEPALLQREAQALAEALVEHTGSPPKGMPREPDDACAQAAARTIVARGP